MNDDDEVGWGCALIVVVVLIALGFGGFVDGVIQIIHAVQGR